MFNLIRRISHGYIQRPDRPWEEDGEPLFLVHTSLFTRALGLDSGVEGEIASYLL